MDELQPQLRNVELWQKKMQDHLTKNNSSSNKHCTTYTVQQHDVDDTATIKSDQSKAQPPNTPGARESEDGIHQHTPTPENNTQGLGEQMHSCYEATQRCPQTHASPTSKYQFFGRVERQYHKIQNIKTMNSIPIMVSIMFEIEQYCLIFGTMAFYSVLQHLILLYMLCEN